TPPPCRAPPSSISRSASTPRARCWRPTSCRPPSPTPRSAPACWRSRARSTSARRRARSGSRSRSRSASARRPEPAAGRPTWSAGLADVEVDAAGGVAELDGQAGVVALAGDGGGEAVLAIEGERGAGDGHLPALDDGAGDQGGVARPGGARLRRLHVAGGGGVVERDPQGRLLGGRLAGGEPVLVGALVEAASLHRVARLVALHLGPLAALRRHRQRVGRCLRRARPAEGD